MKTKSDLIIIMFFFVTICLPAITFVCGIPDSALLCENRVLALRPSVPKNIAGLKTFPKTFENYFNEHFNFRKHFTRWNNIVEVLWLKVSPGMRGGPVKSRASNEKLSRVQYFNGIVAGINSWYFWAQNGMIPDYRGCNPFSEKELQHFKQILEKRRSWLNDQGIAYFFIVVPEKHTVYPEYLPSNIHRTKAPSRLEQLIRYMNKHSDLCILDFRSLFSQAKQTYEYPLYDPTGTHWNDLGAFIAYHFILSTISKNFPSLKPLPLSAFYIETKTTTAMPFLRQLGLQDRVYQETVKLHPTRNRRSVLSSPASLEAVDRYKKNIYTPGENIIKETGDTKLPRAVVFHDSFMREGLEAFFSEHFERIEYYWWVEFNPDIIRKAKPDIVIEEYAERALLDYLPTDNLAQ